MSTPSSSSDSQLGATMARAPAAAAGDLVLTLNPNDVIFGRGAGYCQFSGNQKFRQIVSQMKDTYKNTDRNGKHQIACYVIEYIQKQLSGRFLKEKEEQKKNERRVWQEVTHKEALEKTKQALRERKNEEHEKRVAALRLSQAQSFVDPSSVASSRVPMAAATAARQEQVALLNASPVPGQAWSTTPATQIDATQSILGHPSFSTASLQGFQPTQSLSNAWIDPTLHGQVLPDAPLAAAARLSAHQSLAVNDLLQREFSIFADSLLRHASDLFTSSIVRNSLQNTPPLQSTARPPSHAKHPLEQDTTNTIRLAPSVAASGHLVSQASAQNEAQSKQMRAGAIQESAQKSSGSSLIDKLTSSDEVSEQVSTGVVQELPQKASVTISSMGEPISSDEVRKQVASQASAQNATGTSSLIGMQINSDKVNEQARAGAVQESVLKASATVSSIGAQIGSDEVHESAAIDTAASTLVNIVYKTTEKEVDFLMSALLDDPDAPRITREQEDEERDRLSAEEKEELLADLFGDLCQVSPSIKRLKLGADVGTYVQSLLRDMKIEIENMSLVSKMALLEAQKKAAAKEFSDERMKLFLHREDMNARMAARRFVLYWKKRREWFGADKFCLPMTQSGALRDDHVALRCGYLSILDDLDASGRQIMVLQPCLNTFEGYGPESWVRSWWYIMEVVSEHVNAHKGFVILNWGKGNLIWNFDRKAKGFKAILEMGRDAWPIKHMSMHVWHQNPFVASYQWPIVAGLTDKRFRCRRVVHSRDEDVVRVMESYGIPEDILPMELGGKLAYNHNEWLVRRQRFEEQRDADAARHCMTNG